MAINNFETAATFRGKNKFSRLLDWKKPSPPTHPVPHLRPLPATSPPAGVPIPPSSAHHPLTSTRRPAPGLVFNPRRGASVTFDSRKNRRCSADEVLLSQVLLSIRPAPKTDRSSSVRRRWFRGRAGLARRLFRRSRLSLRWFLGFFGILGGELWSYGRGSYGVHGGVADTLYIAVFS